MRQRVRYAVQCGRSLTAQKTLKLERSLSLAKFEVENHFYR